MGETLLYEKPNTALRLLNPAVGRMFLFSRTAAAHIAHRRGLLDCGLRQCFGARLQIDGKPTQARRRWTTAPPIPPFCRLWRMRRRPVRAPTGEAAAAIT